MIRTFRVKRYYLQNVLKYMSLIQLIFTSIRVSMESMFTKTKVKLEVSTDIDILLMVEKGI